MSILHILLENVHIKPPLHSNWSLCCFVSFFHFPLLQNRTADQNHNWGEGWPFLGRSWGQRSPSSVEGFWREGHFRYPIYSAASDLRLWVATRSALPQISSCKKTAGCIVGCQYKERNTMKRWVKCWSELVYRQLRSDVCLIADQFIIFIVFSMMITFSYLCVWNVGSVV